MYPRRLTPLTLQSVAFGSVTSSYTLLGSVTTGPARIVRWLNTTDQDVLISWDGTHDHQYLASGSFILLDCTANQVKDDGLFVQLTQNFYVKYVSVGPAEGGIYLEVYIAVGGEQSSVPPVPS